MKKIVLISLLVILVIACNNNSGTYNGPLAADKIIGKTDSSSESPTKDTLVNIYRLIRKSPKQVKVILGEPTKVVKNPTDCGILSEGCDLEYDFNGGDITVIFNNNQALWFEFDNVGKLISEDLPACLGLPSKNPTEKTDGYIWYKNYKGIYNIAFIPEKSYPSFVDYIIVNVVK